MSVANSFSYVARDPRWAGKMFKGSLLSAVPLVSAIANGYQIQTVRNIMDGKERPLPEWSNYGAFLSDGIKVTAAKYIVNAPVVVAGIILFIADFVQGSRWIKLAWALVTGNKIDATSLVAFVLMTVIHFVFGLVLGAMLLTLPVMVLRCAQGASFLSLFNVFSHLRFIYTHFRACFLTYLIALVVASIFSSLASAVGASLVLIPVGLFIYAVGKFWRRLAWAHTLAEAGMDDRRKAALAGRPFGPPSAASGGLVLVGLFGSFVLSILVTCLLLWAVSSLDARGQTPGQETTQEVSGGGDVRPAPPSSSPGLRATPPPYATPTPSPTPDKAQLQQVVNRYLAGVARVTGKADEPKQFRKIAYGDFDGDGDEDAVVQFTLEGMGGGNSWSLNIAAFRNNDGQFEAVTDEVVGGKLYRSFDLTTIQNRGIVGQIEICGEEDFQRACFEGEKPLRRRQITITLSGNKLNVPE